MNWFEALTVGLTIFSAFATVVGILAGFIAKRAVRDFDLLQAEFNKHKQETADLKTAVELLKSSKIMDDVKDLAVRQRTLENDMAQLKGDIREIRNMLTRVLEREGNA